LFQAAETNMAMTSKLAHGAAATLGAMALMTAGSCFLVPSGVHVAGQSGVALRGAAAISPSVARLAAITQASDSSSVALVLLAAITLAGGAAVRASRSSSRRGLVACKANLVATRPDQVIPWWDRCAKPQIESGIGIWAEKLNMTQIFQKKGDNHRMVPCTILAVKQGGNIITDKKWPEKHGYYSVQVGYDRYEPPAEHLKGGWGARFGALEKNGIPPLKKLKEFRMRPQDWDKYEIGQKLWPSDLFMPGCPVHVHGQSKGKGFQGRIARWAHHGGKKHMRGPMTHGSKHHRRHGSVGAGTTPGRVLPSHKMPGWGGDRSNTSATKILKIVDRLNEDNMPETIIVVAGGVPGYSAFGDKGGSYVWLCKDKKIEMSKGRFKRDPVWFWYTRKGENVDQLVPMRGKQWAWKTFWGRDTRWITSEVKKYWPDGFPGYDHSCDPFYDGCNEHDAIKAPEW